MERGEPDAALTAEHDGTVVTREHIDVVTGALDDGRADEDAGERAAGETVDLERGLERVALAPVAVAAHGHVEQPERLLVGATVDDVTGEHDEAGARSERGKVVAQPLRQRRAQLRRVEQLVDRGRLTAGHEDRVDAGEMFRSADERDVGAERLQRLRVLAERALQREDTDFHGRALTAPAALRSPSPSARPMAWGPRVHRPRHQPRSASFTSSLSISAPRIASPRPRDTLATMSASV